MRRLQIVASALTLALAAGAARGQDENPTTPGAIPNPGSYQGSLQLQQQQDRQDQQFRQQQYQQQQPYQQSYPRPQYRQPGYGAAPRSAPAPTARTGAQPFGQGSPGHWKAVALAQRGDYAGALRIWRPLAASGDVNAQYSMGLMYETGKGVPVNDAVAAGYYRKAAQRGMGPAMLNLSNILLGHARKPSDLVPAYTWLLILDAHDPSMRASARRNMGMMGQVMSPALIAQARVAAREWQPR